MTTHYVQSTARSEFGRSMFEIRKVMKQIAPPKRIDPDLKNYVLGASVLFISAKLENFIADLFGGICLQACHSIKSASGIPAPLLGWVFLNDGHHENSKRFIATSDEGAMIGVTGNYLMDTFVRNAGSYLVPERFNKIADKAYPSVVNIKRMYKRIGVDNIFSRLSARLRRNAENDVISLNSVRGSLAHVGVAGVIAYGDVKSHVERITRVVEALDKETFYHLRHVGAELAWKC